MILTYELQRFWRQVLGDGSGCLLWKGPTLYGYGKFKSEGVSVIAHRWAYKYFVGPIPLGLHLDHLCRKRACVNVMHLEAVTPEENSHRTRKTFCKRGHAIVESNGKRWCRVCVRDAYRNGKRWLIIGPDGLTKSQRYWRKKQSKKAEEKHNGSSRSGDLLQ